MSSPDDTTGPPPPPPLPPIHPKFVVDALKKVLPSTSDQSRAMVVLVSLIAISGFPFPAEIFYKLTKVHRTWSEDGETVASRFGTTKELSPVLPKNDKEIKSCLEDLIRVKVISKVLGRPDMLTFDGGSLEVIAPDLGDFQATEAYWCRRSLLALCRLVPFRYLDPEPSRQVQAYVSPILESCIDEIDNEVGFSSMPASERKHVAMCLVEVSRWFLGTLHSRATRLAVAVAGETTYVSVAFSICQQVVAEKREMAVRDNGHGLSRLRLQVADTLSQAPRRRTRLAHAMIGLVHVEKSLIHLKRGYPAAAAFELTNWLPFPCASMSQAETAVQFQKDLLRGMYLRHSGKFQESLHALLSCRHFIDEVDTKSVVWAAERATVACEMGAVLRELGSPEQAETLLVEELSRRPPMGSQAILTVILAEALFAQGRMEESYSLCEQAEGLQYGDPKRSGRINSCFIKAKIHHLRFEVPQATHWWKETLGAMRGLSMSGRSTHLVVRVSLKEITNQQVIDIAVNRPVPAECLVYWLERAKREYWLPGITDWQRYIETVIVLRHHFASLAARRARLDWRNL